MSEKKKIFYKTLNNIVATSRIDNEESYIINDYISSLENIIKELRNIVEDMNKWKSYSINGYTQIKILNKDYNNFLQILDKENEE